MKNLINVILRLSLLLGQVFAYSAINSTDQLENYLADCLGSLYANYNITHDEYNMTTITPYEYRSTDVTGLDMQLMSCLGGVLFPYHVVGFVPNQEYAHDTGMYDSDSEDDTDVEDDTDIEDDTGVEDYTDVEDTDVESFKRITAKGYAYAYEYNHLIRACDTPLISINQSCAKSKNIKDKSLYACNPILVH